MLPPGIAASYRASGLWPAETLGARAATVAARHSGRVALIDGSRHITFADATTMIERVAGHLRRLGVDRGDVVSWQLPNWWESAIVHHAALRIGALPNPLNLIFRERELSYVLAEAQPSVILAPKSFRGFDHASALLSIAPQPRLIVVRGSVSGALSLDDLLSEDIAAAPLSGEPPDPALLLYTSGTTSDPKGVVHSHETLLYEISSLASVHSLTTDDRYLGGSPVTHVAGLVYGVLMPFVLGTSTVLLERWDPAAAVEAVRRDDATFQTGAPAFLQTLAAEARSALPGFRLFSTGGASIDTAMIAKAESILGCTVKRAYGSTEVPTLTATSFDDAPAIRLGTDGRAIGSAEMRIVRDGAEVAAGDEGEIWARSPEMFVGYRNATLNHGAFTEDGWFQTGDLGTVDADGVLRVTGRLKDIIIRGGENISAVEIEALILTHPSVADVAVVGMPDVVLGERACAFVVVRDGATITLELLVAHLESQHIAKQKLPERVIEVAALPRTASGKVAKAALREQLR